MANFANPTVGSNYTAFPGEIRDSVNAALQQLSIGTHTNIPTGAIKFDTTDNRWKKFNGSAFVDLTTNYNLNANVNVTQLDLADNEKIRLGNNQDLQIYHNANDSIIEDAGTGKLRLFTNGQSIDFFNSPGNALLARFLTGSSCELYENGTKRLETDGNGIQVTSRVGIGGVASVPLDVFGTGQIGASNTDDAELRIGRSGSGNRNAYIDLIGDNTYSDYGVRIIRNDDGANSHSEIRHRGTGNFNLINQEVAEFRFYTNNSQKAVITSTGRLGIGLTSPDVAIHTRDGGSVYALFGGNQNSDGSSAIRQLKLFTTGFRGAIQSLQASGSGFSNNDLLLQPDGSSVLIGAAGSPQAKLDVSRLGGAWTGQSPIAGTTILAHSGNVSSTTSPSYLALAAGTASISGIVFGDADDIDIGKIFYSHSNNSLRFDVNTSEKFRILSDGRVGIGTSSPTEELTIESATPAIMLKDTDLANTYVQLSAGNGDMFLSANDTQHNGQFFFRSGLNGTFTERARIQNLGRLGLGTSNPSSLLHLIGTQTITAGAFSNNVSTGNKDFTASVDIQATSMRGGVVVRNMNDFRSTGAFNASFMHYDPYDTTATSFAFRVARGATLVDTFTVRSDGRTYVGERLGVGTSSPERSLHVVGSDCRIKLTDSDVTTDVELQNSSGNGVLTTNGVSHLLFMNNNSERVRIDSTGRLLINRTSGDFHLDVSGAARISSHFYMSNNQRIQWGGSNVAYIQGNDNDNLIFAVASEIFRIVGGGLRLAQTTQNAPGSGNTTVGIGLETNGRISGSTSGTTTGLTLNANTSSTGKHFCAFRRNGTLRGSIKQTSGGVQFNTTSDRRLKENIIDIKDALLTLLKLKPKEYNWKSDNSKVTEHGFIAQDLLEDKVCEYAVGHSTDEETGEDSYGMDYGRLTAITIAAIHELAAKVSDLESKLA